MVFVNFVKHATRTRLDYERYCVDSGSTLWQQYMPLQSVLSHTLDSRHRLAGRTIQYYRRAGMPNLLEPKQSTNRLSGFGEAAFVSIVVEIDVACLQGPLRRCPRPLIDRQFCREVSHHISRRLLTIHCIMSSLPL